MDASALESHIQTLEEENQLLAQTYKATTSALLDRVHQLEEDLKSRTSAPPPGPPMGACQDCGAQLTMEDAMNHVCGAKPTSVKAAPSAGSLAEQARQLLQTDSLMAFKKLVAQGLPLDTYYNLIHEGVKAGAMKIVNYLRGQNVNLNAVTAQGDNVVTLAAETNQRDTLCVLLQHAKDRIDLEHTNKLGLTGIQVAVKNGLKDIVGLLSEHGANLNVVNGLGDTLIQMAQRAGQQEVVMLLVNVGAPLR